MLTPIYILLTTAQYSLIRFLLFGMFIDEELLPLPALLYAYIDIRLFVTGVHTNSSLISLSIVLFLYM